MSESQSISFDKKEQIPAEFGIGSPLSNAAAKEGWAIFDCYGSQNGPWQIQGFDTPEDMEEIIGTVPPAITDNEAWKKVMEGVKEHHVAAREFIRLANPKEYEAMQKSVGFNPRPADDTTTDVPTKTDH